MAEHPMVIPDELLAWGRSPAVESRFSRPWASVIAKMIQMTGDRALRADERTKLLSHLEALCVEAVRAGRVDLLSGIDTRTAETLKLSYSFERDGKTIMVGEGGDYTWDELRAILSSDDPKEALKHVERVKDLLSESFPEARVGLVYQDGSESDTCASCKTPGAQVMMLTESGLAYCGKCWLHMTSEFSMTIVSKRKSNTAGESRLLTRTR